MCMKTIPEFERYKHNSGVCNINKSMKKLTIILPTEVPLESAERQGFLLVWKIRFLEYLKYFEEVEIYSFDSKNYSRLLGVKHYPFYFNIKLPIPYIKHVFYNIYLIFNAKKMSNTVRIFFTTFFVLGLIKKIFQKRIVLSYHYFYASSCKSDFGWVKGLMAPYLEKFSIMSADVIFAPTDEITQYLLKKYGKRAEVLPEIVDPHIFYSSKKMEKARFILYAGRLIWSKGIGYLLKAFRILSNEFPDYTLRIAGGEHKKIEEYRKLSTELNLKNVEFMGHVPHGLLANLMRKATAIILPTVTSEGQAKVLVEGMACGAVCIATDIPGNRGTIKHKFNGILVQPKNYIELANAIKEVIVNAKLRKKIIKNAVHTSKSFAVSKVIEEEVKIIAKV